jgi:co-chaperonin GroES (HSP10)
MNNFPVEPVSNWIAVDLIDTGAKVLQSGIIIQDDDMKKHGIRPRWAKVIAVGPDVHKEGDINPGNFLLLEHLGWTRAIDVDMDGEDTKVYWTIPEKVVLISDETDEKKLPLVTAEQ